MQAHVPQRRMMMNRARSAENLENDSIRENKTLEMYTF